MDNQLTLVNEHLGTLLKSKSEALPKNFNSVRFLQNCLTVLQDVDKQTLAKLTPESISNTMIKGAFLGLDFFNREAYAIPFGRELQFIPDYKGRIKVCMEYSVKPLKSIYAKIVREGDILETKIENGQPIINFTPIPLNDGNILGAFAVAVFDNSSIQYTTMSRKEIEATRQNWSKCSTSKAWRLSFDQMCLKTVLGRLTKMIPLNFDNAEQDKAYQDDSELDLGKVVDIAETKVKDPFDLTEKKTEKIENAGDNSLDILISIKNYLADLGKSPTLVNKYSNQLFNKVSDLLTTEEMKTVSDVIRQEVK